MTTQRVAPPRKRAQSPTTVSGCFVSVKNNKVIIYQGVLVHDLLSMLEIEPNVRNFRVDPPGFYYKDKMGKECIYAADVEVEFRGPCRFSNDGLPLMIEVKQFKDLQKHCDKYEASFDEARKQAAENNKQFAVFTEEQIEIPFLKNANFFRFMRRHLPAIEDQDIVRSSLKRAKKTTVYKLVQSITRKKSLQERHRLLACVWYLVAMREIVADWDQEITFETLICLPK